ncbi:MAG: VCBS repeat-containing protein [Planctomycetes bacterium]|nr:VCBS repeat-containing protein [Planctomycetota bacterium]MCL4730700.1 VCBS repeat-containing protein [Planctomycetota bacterium]
MRAAICLCLLAVVATLARAQDARPDKLAELEKRARDLETEAERLRREAEALRREIQSLRGGPVVWTLDLASDLKGSGAVGDVDGDGKPEIVFGTYYRDEHVYCVEAATGRLKWKFKSHGGPLDASIAIADLDGDKQPEVLAADSAFGKLYVLNGKGELKGTIDLPSGTDSPPAVADLDGDGKVEIVIGTMWRDKSRQGWVCCYDGASRALKWQRQLAGCIQSEPCLVDLNGDKVLDAVVTCWMGDRKVSALDGRNGEILWQYQTPGNEKTMGMYHGVALGADTPRLYASTTEGDIFALDFAGKEVWKKKYQDYLFAPITVAKCDDRECLALGGHNIYLLKADDGTELWSHAVSGGLDRGMAVCDADGDGDDDLIYNEGKSVVARDLKTGAETFRHDCGFGKGMWEKLSSAPLVADFDGDGRLEYFAVCGSGTSENQGKDNYGRAFALRLKGKAAPWTTFRGNLRRTGNAAQRDGS